MITNVKFPKGRKKLISIYDKDEQIKFLNVLDLEPEGILFKFIINTGMRASEVCGLRWEKVDLKNRIIYVKKSFQQITIYDDELNKVETVKKETEVKTEDSYREVPILESLYNDILKYKEKIILKKKKQGKEFLEEDFVFKTIHDEPLITDNIAQRLKRLIKKYDLKKIGVHALRHSFATRCLESGMQPKVLQEILGHADYSTTANIYLHVTKKNKLESISKLDYYLKESINM